MVGGMGHTSSVATGFSINTKKQIFCLDGDGSVLMHLGALSTIGNLKRKNLKHIILNNNCHESVGGQPTGAEKIDFLGLSKSFVTHLPFKYPLFNIRHSVKLGLKSSSDLSISLNKEV